MSTHVYECANCGTDTLCTSSSHALGDPCYGDGPGPHIELCSLECALALQDKIARGIANYRGLYPGTTEKETEP